MPSSAGSATAHWRIDPEFGNAVDASRLGDGEDAPEGAPGPRAVVPGLCAGLLAVYRLSPSVRGQPDSQHATVPARIQFPTPLGVHADVPSKQLVDFSVELLERLPRVAEAVVIGPGFDHPTDPGQCDKK